MTDQYPPPEPFDAGDGVVPPEPAAAPQPPPAAPVPPPAAAYPPDPYTAPTEAYPSTQGQPQYVPQQYTEPQYTQPQYTQPQYTPGQYAAPAPYPVATATTSNDAVVALVLAICSWVFCPVILAVVALVFAGRGRRAIDASGGWVTGDGIVTAAKVISWINIGLYLAILVIGVVVLIGAAVSTSVSS